MQDTVVKSKTWTFPSTFESLPRAVHAMCGFLEGLDAVEHTRFSVVARELLMNAHVHGNKRDSSRAIFCKVDLVDGRDICVTVEDEGDGFDHASLDMALPEDPRRSAKRGYALVRALSDRIEFGDKGRRVRVCFGLNAEERNTTEWREEDGAGVGKPPFRRKVVGKMGRTAKERKHG